MLAPVSDGLAHQLSLAQWSVSRQQLSSTHVHLVLNKTFGEHLLVLRDRIQVRSQSHTSPSDLKFDNRDGLVVVSAAEVNILNRSLAVGYDSGTDVGVSLRSPTESSRDWISDIQALGPARGLGSVDAAVDGSVKGRSPGFRIRKSVAAGELLGDFCVPDVVQVGRGSGKSDVDVVATDLESFVVQRLVNVTNEVDDKPERVVDLGIAQSGRNDTLSVVCNSTVWKEGTRQPSGPDKRDALQTHLTTQPFAPQSRS
jgi:hypothetical protein